MIEWISVKDRLPAEGENVLAYDTQRIYICYRAKEEEYNEHWVICEENCCCTGCTGAITNWMPLPKPPKQENDKISTASYLNAFYG